MDLWFGGHILHCWRTHLPFPHNSIPKVKCSSGKYYTGFRRPRGWSIMANLCLWIVMFWLVEPKGSPMGTCVHLGIRLLWGIVSVIRAWEAQYTCFSGKRWWITVVISGRRVGPVVNSVTSLYHPQHSKVAAIDPHHSLKLTLNWLGWRRTLEAKVVG